MGTWMTMMRQVTLRVCRREPGGGMLFQHADLVLHASMIDVTEGGFAKGHDNDA
jgi:hypothetical protein